MESNSNLRNLSNLIRQNQNSKQIYTDAVQVTSNRDLRKYLINRTEDWNRYVDQIGVHLENEPTPKTGTLVGNLRSTWFTLQGDIMGLQQSQILDTLIRQENVMLKKYGQVCSDQSLPEEVRSVLARQVASIETAQRNLAGWKQEE